MSTAVLGLAWALATAADPLDLEPEDLHPGLVGKYRSAEASVHLVDPKPAFNFGRSSPHPRLPAGPLAATWTGVVSIRDPGPLTFFANVGGTVAVEVDGVTVLDGRGTTEGSRVAGTVGLTRRPGYYPLTIRFRSIADVPARLQLGWAGPGFAAEIIPAWRFGHTSRERTPAVTRDLLAGRGRRVVGRLGCAACHASTFPAVSDPPPGPSLADARTRLDRAWLLDWLAGPAKMRADAHMPALFAADRTGFVERWLIAGHLGTSRETVPVPGDHRAGRIAFIGLGCAACHLVPDVKRDEQEPLNRTALTGLGDRFTPAGLAQFLTDPHGRYPDGRMPRLPVTADQARNIAAYLLLWTKPTERPAPESPTDREIQDVLQRLKARDRTAAATALLTAKGCVGCHPGLGDARPTQVQIATAEGCLTGQAGPRYALTDDARREIAAYLEVAAKETAPSPFAVRQEKLARAGCVQCHQRDTDRPPPIEQVGSQLGGGHLAEIPFLRTPRLSNPHQKLTRSHLATTVRDGLPPLRGPRYSYRMPAFGKEADELVRALAEADGELVAADDPPATAAQDPTLGTLHGSRLAGVQGYGCVSCHVWNGRHLASADPVATGPDLTRTVGRVRRDWFERFVENPARYYPGTPMPAIFPHRQAATLAGVLDGDPARQKDALWAYFALGKDAPSPKPPPPVPVAAPAAGEAPIVAQIPIRFADGTVAESLTLLSARHDLLVYDLGTGRPHALLVGGQILRNVQGRIRQFLAAGTPFDLGGPSEPRLVIGGKTEAATERTLLGYDRLPDGARVRWTLKFPSGRVDVEDVLHLPAGRTFGREVRASGLPAGASLELSDGKRPRNQAADPAGKAAITVTTELPAAKTPPAWDVAPVVAPDPLEGSLERPGYRASVYPRPKTIAGEDRVMPGAVAVRPKDGQVFVASLKTGELFALRDPTGDGKQARFDNYGHGLFQDALSMRAENDGLYVLHRRNLTRITEAGGRAERFDRVAALPHGIADTYDMAYGLARDAKGAWVFGYAPYANTTMPGSGGAVRLVPGQPPEEVAYGMRNPLGWCTGPGGEVFFTDNQGDWVATNKLCHLEAGKFYGWPNRAQPQHHRKPGGKAAVWVPYGWAQSINGVAHDDTGGRFGPFAGQLFLAELMFGGAIIRADVEAVNGVYQGACFPFWGKGLLGPLCLAFDPRGRLYVGGITEPGWMAQPDRGALFRIDYTGRVPFEMKTIRVRPNGFRIVFTRPVDRATAGDPAAYRLEHHRYEYTGAYGSPEMDRTPVKVQTAEVAADGLSVELTTSPLVTDRVYRITATGVKSASGESLVFPTGAYTLNAVPR